ncbi:mycofactocin biosynthesis glycosyltransferase MftF [Jatrophihabitans sp. YIM 134969]
MTEATRARSSGRPWSLAPGVLRLRDDRLAGGAPFRVVRLSPEGARGLADLLGTTAPPPPGLTILTDRLVRYGLLLPPPPDVDDTAVDDVTVVIPALSAPGPVAAVLAAVPDGVPVVVVDDGSPEPLQDALLADGAVACRNGFVVLRNPTPTGPAAARNAGAARATTTWVAFVDADVDPEPGWLGQLLAAARADPAVVAVGPRVRSRASRGLGGQVERFAGGLDLGPVPADVVPGGPVGYLPTAVLLVDRSAFERIGGFDAAMPVAEDVDLVWRLREEGVVRYVPSVAVWHAPRPSLRAVLQRRRFYGSGAALLDARHPGVVRHADVSVFSIVPWLLGIAVRPWLAVAGAAASVAVAPRTLRSLPAADALRLAAYGQGIAAVSFGRFALRPWWPLTVALCIISPKRRRVLALVAATGLLDIVRRARRDESLGTRDLPAVVVSRLLDDLAYSVGVLEGAARARRIAPLLPRVRGRTRA